VLISALRADRQLGPLEGRRLVKSALKDAGVSEDAAQLIASLTGGATAASIGGAVGGTAGAATAFNADMNNRQLHPSERKLAQELAKKSGGGTAQRRLRSRCA